MGLSDRLFTLLCIVPLLGMVTCTQRVVAQEFVLSPFASYEYGVPLSLQRSAGYINRYNAQGSGTSSNHSLTFGGELLIPKALGQGDGVVRIGLEMGRGKFDSDPFEAPFGVDPQHGGGVVVDATFGIRSSTSSIRLESSYSESFGAYRWSAGVWGSFRLSSAYFQIERLIAPEWARFPDMSTERTVGSGDHLGGSLLRAGGVLSVGRSLALTPRLALQAAAIVRVDAGALAEGLGVRSVSAGISVSAAMGLPLEKASTRAEGVPEAGQSIASPPPPSATIDLSCDQPAGGCRMLQRTVRHVVFRSLLPLILFDGAGTDLPRRYDTIATGAMEPRDVARLTPEELNASVLSILAERLRQGAAAVTLRPAGRRHGNDDERRLQAVTNRLRALGVRPDQIKAGEASRLPVDRPSVLLETNPPSILSPYAAWWLESESYLPPLSLRREISAPAGLRGWTVRVEQAGRELARYSSEQPAIGEIWEIAAATAADGGYAAPPIVAILEVEDVLNRRAVAADTLVMERGRALDMARATEEVVLLELIAPDELGDLAAVQNRGMWETLGEHLRDRSDLRVRLTGADISDVIARLSSALGGRTISPESIVVERDGAPGLFGRISVRATHPIVEERGE